MAGSLAPFEFKQCVSVIKATGTVACNLGELRAGIQTVSDGAIFHHTYQYFLKGHVFEYTNDFAHWAGEYLQERALAEHFSNIDPYALTGVSEVRQELLRVIDHWTANFPGPREALVGEEFYFNDTVTIIFPLGIRARNLAEFLAAIKYVDWGSIYYHFLDARVRLGGGTNDFSLWIASSLEKKDLADVIQSIDPFVHTVEEIREHIAEAVERRLREEMGFTSP